MQFLFIDGLTNETEHNILQSHAILWQKKNKLLNKLVMICSMASRNDKTRIEQDKKAGIETFMMSSWTLAEFQEASEEFLNPLLNKESLKNSPTLVGQRILFLMFRRTKLKL
jgi:tellurite resistance protein